MNLRCFDNDTEVPKLSSEYFSPIFHILIKRILFGQSFALHVFVVDMKIKM